VTRIVICGVAGHNRGDDAIAMALAEGILARKPQASLQIAMLQRGSIPETSRIKTFVARRGRPQGLLNLFLNIARSDLVILGGGSLIQDKFGGDRIRGVLGYAWLVSALAALLRKPLVTAPLGVDSLGSARAIAVSQEILRRCAIIFVRDNRSLENARAYGGTLVASPRRVCDPAFALSEKPRGPVTDSAPIVLAPAFEGEFDALVADIFARTAEAARARTGRRVVIVAMDDRAEEDAGKIAMILDRIDPRIREFVDLATPADLPATLDLLRGSAGIIAMRLHALILGYGFVPLACLSRTTKTEAFMEDYAVSGAVISPQAEPSVLAQGLAEAIASWPYRDAQRAIRSQRLEELGGYFDAILLKLR
jgi:polysaccharide pyruvyl transferase WcaK-like protein